MPYKEHPVFQSPNNEDVKIWRYMDFAKFISLIDRRALFFYRADLMANRFDPQEAQYPRPIVNKLIESAIEHGVEDNLNSFLQFGKNTRRHNIVNCWHINEEENNAMWKIYSPRGYGIAIQSTYAKLKMSFDTYKSNDVYIGKVIYDPKTIDLGNDYVRYLLKRKCFEYENELRILISNIWDNRFENKINIDRINNDGEYIPVDLDKLLENVYVAPFTEKWLIELTRSVLTNYKINKEVKESEIDKEAY